MERTFASEDIRKTGLFEAWIEYLSDLHLRFEGNLFDEIYEGMATVSDLSKNRIGFHLDDGRKLRHIPITPEISKQSCRLDAMYVALGLIGGRWWPLDVISIGSLIWGEPHKAHITYNPLYVPASSQTDCIQ